MSSRSYPVPARISAVVEGDGPLARRVRDGESLTTSDLGRAALIATGTPLGEWAQQILANEQAVILDALLPDDRLPMGVLASGTEDDIIVALSLGDRVFTASGWADSDESIATDCLMELDEETVVAVAEALADGADGLVLRPWIPLAVIAAAPAPAAMAKPKTAPRPGQKVDQPAAAPTGDSKPLTPAQADKTDQPETTTELESQDEPPEGATESDVPAGAKVVAVVDDLDKTAVIELLAIAPGPKVYRRNDGTWTEDPKWVTALRSVKPPPLVQLSDPSQIEDVTAQVDEATKGMPFDPAAEKKPEAPDAESGESAPDAESGTEDAAEAKPKPMAASAEWAAEHQRKADDLAAQLALVAASKAGATLKGKATGAEKLRRYWLSGEGALKIRWGAPGDWKRCVRHLSKFMGPRATGYCSLLHARKTGAWTGSKVHRKAHGGMYANPKVKAEALAKELSH